MEISPNPEESSNAVTVQVDVHHRHCSQLSASVATTNHVCVNETQATSDVSSIHPGYPKTAAERMREYRARKKKETLTVNHQKQKRSAAERAKEYRIRKKMKIHSGDSTMEISPNPEESSNAVTVQVDVHHRHCSQLSTSVATTSHVCVNETQATSDVSSIHPGYPKTAAERMREYRARKKKKLTVNHQKQKRSAAERVKDTSELKPKSELG
ncbi:hypothetical protein KQX54_014269 [Cotesia glomerata]|uniref:Uncharacterized protein n=1 Tax=Cotesia glomerata TaxID=32391 RepID=A0AAV7I7J3_COTGL|nr:hypothetical protein KQX54_014269 [Cotesia glomerata]